MDTIPTPFVKHPYVDLSLQARLELSIKPRTVRCNQAIYGGGTCLQRPDASLHEEAPARPGEEAS